MISENKMSIILNQIYQLESLDTAVVYTKSNNFAQEEIEIFNNKLIRVLTQLKNELTNGLKEMLPFQYSYSNEYDSGNLENDLTTLFTILRNSGISQDAKNIINRLIYYQIVNGFWDKSERKLHAVEEINVKELKQSVNTLKVLLEKKFQETVALNSELDKLITQKAGELQQIERNLNTSTINTDQIGALLNSGTEKNERINGILIQQSEKYEEAKKLFENQKNEFGNYLIEFGSLQLSLENGIKTIEEKQIEYSKILEFYESKKSYFDERTKHLESLVGHAVGANLFQTFQSRKLELKPSVRIWAIGVFVTTILIIGWIFILFRNTSTGGLDLNWELFALNTLKTIPAIVLLYFVINQYRKERNFQEEYAFKSAVALTIVEYSKQLNIDENKDRLILDGVNKIFRSPIYNKTTSSSIEESINPKEIYSDVKATVGELVKSGHKR